MNKMSTIAALATLFATPALAQKPQIQWDESYPFDSIETFQWQSTPGSSLEERNPFMHSLIVTAIEYELAGSGLTEVQSNPDVFITYYATSISRLRLQSNSYGYGFGGYGRGGWSHYGYGAAGPLMTTTDVVEYAEGTLVIDIWDSSTDQLIWRGTVSRVISDNVEKVERQAVKAIEAMAKQGRKLWQRAQR